MDDTADLAMITSSGRGVVHRRSRSDPSEFLRSLRADRFEDGSAVFEGEEPMATGEETPVYAADSDSRPPSSNSSDADDEPASTRQMCSSLFANLPFPGPSPSMFTPEELAQPKLPNYSKKDVPMWTVEEDLLILQLVEQHGKKWSKIAAHLPGRTDNGVRNRWNRMERAQVLRQRRGPEAGYRCRRCGQPKRGHICAALTLGDTPAGEELQQKAEALSKLSANRMRPPSATSEVSEAPPASAQSTPSLAPERAPSPELPLLKWGAPGVIKPAADALATASAAPADSTSVTGLPQMVYQEAPMDAEMIKGELGSAPAAADERGSMFGSMFDDFQLDDFLDELQLEFVKPPQQQPVVTAGAPAPALLSQASLQSLLMTLSSNETSFASVASQLNQPAMPVFC